MAKLQNKDLELESFVQIVKKAVGAEAKLNLRPRVTTRDMDQHCPRGSWPANTTAAKASTQGQLMKDPRVEEPKAQSPKLLTAPPRSNNSEFSAKVQWDKKKNRRRYDQPQRQQKSSTPATGVNAGEPSEANKKKNDDRNQNRSGGEARDLSQIKCFNCQKIGHYASNCPKSRN